MNLGQHIVQHIITEAESQIKTVIAIYPGRFQPMGKHHAQVYDWLAGKFVNMDNGDILKSGGWKAPAPNGVRGNIFDTDLGASVVNEMGANYLRGPRW